MPCDGYIRYDRDMVRSKAYYLAGSGCPSEKICLKYSRNAVKVLSHIDEVRRRRGSRQLFDMSKLYNVLNYVFCERSVDAMAGGRSVDGRWWACMTPQMDATQTGSS